MIVEEPLPSSFGTLGFLSTTGNITFPFTEINCAATDQCIDHPFLMLSSDVNLDIDYVDAADLAVDYKGG